MMVNMSYLSRTNVTQIRFEYDSMFELPQIYSEKCESENSYSHPYGTKPII